MIIFAKPLFNILNTINSDLWFNIKPIKVNYNIVSSCCSNKIVNMDKFIDNEKTLEYYFYNKYNDNSKFEFTEADYQKIKENIDFMCSEQMIEKLYSKDIKENYEEKQVTISLNLLKEAYISISKQEILNLLDIILKSIYPDTNYFIYDRLSRHTAKFVTSIDSICDVFTKSSRTLLDHIKFNYGDFNSSNVEKVILINNCKIKINEIDYGKIKYFIPNL